MVCLVEGPEMCEAIWAQYLKASQCVGKLKSGFLLLESSRAFFLSLRHLIFEYHTKMNPNNVDGMIMVSGFRSDLHEFLICDYQHKKVIKTQTKNLNLSLIL
jgi:hypothetical protein